MVDETEDSGTFRRTVLKTAAVAGTTISVGAASVGTTTAQRDQEIELAGQTSAWVGRSPDEIDGDRNPTLELVEGEEYTVTWENQDGAGHNFIIEDEDGEEQFVNTDIVTSAGETQEVAFTAEEGMAEYFCGPHPTSMRGEIELVDEDGLADELEAETDEDGVAEFDLEDGVYEVSAQHDQDSAEDEVEIDGEDEELTLTLEEPTH